MPAIALAMLNRLGAVPAGSYRWAGKLHYHLRWPTTALGAPRPGALKLTPYSLCAQPLVGDQLSLDEPADPIMVCGKCLEAAQRHRAHRPR